MKTAYPLNVKPLALALALAFSGPALAQVAANALPSGATVVNGTVSLDNPAANALRITNTPGAIVNWNSFSIGADAHVMIDQSAGPASAILNRVTGADPSHILGRLDSNGRVFLINPNGMLFGAGSVVDVQSLIASTRDISNSNFLAGNYLFEGGTIAPITVADGAQITTARGPGGQVWMFASQVRLEQGSQVTVPDGQVMLAAGSRLQVGSNTLGNMTFDVVTGSADTIASHGSIAAQRGVVGMFADSIVQGGRLAVGGPGEVQLMAARDITIDNGGSISADGEAGQGGGRIALNAGNRLRIEDTASVSADGSAEGGSGGRIDLIAHDLQVSPVASGMGNVHASARASGAPNGEVRVMLRALPLAAQPATGELAVTLSSGKDMYPDVTHLADGSFVVTWMSMDLPTNVLWDVQYSTVYAQRFSATGEALGGRIQLGSVAGNQSFPSIAPGRNGGFLAVWSDGRTGRREVWGRRFDVNGLPLGADVKLSNDAGDQDNLKVSTLADGRYLVAWSSRPSLSPLVIDVRGQLLDESGLPVGAAFAINPTGAADRGYQYRPEIAPLADGGFVVTYHASAPNAYNADAYGRRFDRNGVPVGPEFVIAASSRDDWRVATSGLLDGGFIVVWDTVNASGANALLYRRYDANGMLVQGDTPVGAAPGGTGQSFAQVAPLADGGFAIAWMSYQNGTGSSNADVYAQRFGADGMPVSAPQLVAGGIPSQWEPRIDATADGGYTLSWYSNQNAGNLDIVAQRFANAVQQAEVAGGVAGELANRGYVTAPGVANGAYSAPVLLVPAPAPAPVEPAPLPLEPAPAPAPAPVVPAPAPVEPSKPDTGKTESAHNEIRRVTPTGRTDFVLPGASPVFAGTNAGAARSAGPAIVLIDAPVSNQPAAAAPRAAEAGEPASPSSERRRGK